MPARRDKRTGRWFFRFFIQGKGSFSGTPGRGKFSGLSNTKKGAEEAERIEREELKTAPAVVRRLITFRDFCESFYLDKMKTVGNKTGKNKQSTLDTKESHLRIHLYPRFGDTRIDEIGDVAIEDFKIAVAKLGRKPKTINNLLTTLLNILVNAKKRGHIAALPEIEWVEVPPQDFDFLDFDEGARLVEATVKVPDWRCAVMLAIKSGMRVGELRALRWEDIDFIKGKLTVCRSLWKKDCEGPPKNGKSRTIDLPASALTALKEHRHLRGERVFLNADGENYTIGEWRAGLYRVARRAGLRKLGWHVLRHTTASHLVMRGESMKVVADLLGHSTITMTNRYAHLAPGAMRAAVAKLDEEPPSWACSTVAANG